MISFSRHGKLRACIAFARHGGTRHFTIANINLWVVGTMDESAFVALESRLSCLEAELVLFVTIVTALCWKNDWNILNTYDILCRSRSIESTYFFDFAIVWDNPTLQHPVVFKDKDEHLQRAMRDTCLASFHHNWENQWKSMNINENWKPPRSKRKASQFSEPPILHAFFSKWCGGFPGNLFFSSMYWWFFHFQFLPSSGLGVSLF